MELTFNQPAGNDENVIFNLDNIKPGDTQEQSFSIQNTGTLNFSKVMLDTDYKVNDAKGDNTLNFGKHIRVELFYNTSKGKKLITKTTLNQLKRDGPIDVIGGDGLPADQNGHYENFYVDISFVDNGEDQNQFQGDSLKLNWTFTAEQEDGEEI
ncbi:TasA family protein [Virgibacillus siamensis]|uniref:TasA family protein n=1 Tax=Virgibacillus siamensis TaxID=480071 RepID=UPI003182CED6